MNKPQFRLWIAILLSVLGCWTAGNRANAQDSTLPEDLSRWAPVPVVIDDPNLPRFLFIGDSISSNYGQAISDLLAGKFNVHQPPTNCQSSGNGRLKLPNWLGEFREKGHQWDVISFNFGHWDVASTKQEYQENLHDIVRQLKETKAQLVWVTTCPVPDGFERVGENKPEGPAPGRKSGVMKSLLNPWAAEVMADYPEITICDQWQFVYEHRNGLYHDWWAGNDIHFSGAPAYGIGRLLAEHVLDLAGLFRGPGWKKADPGVAVAEPNREEVNWLPTAESSSTRGTYYSEAETARNLPGRWQNAQRLPGGFPSDFPISLAPKIPDLQGWFYDLEAVPNHLQLNRIKTEIQMGHRLAWYPIPNADRFRVGPGLTGDQLLADVQSGDFPQHISLEEFIRSVVVNNVSTLYDMYRVTRDRYYSDQIVIYAEAIEQIMPHRPDQFSSSPETSQPLPGNTSPSAIVASQWAHVSAARLLLEQVRVDRGGPTDPRVAVATRLIKTANKQLSSAIARKHQSSGYESSIQLDGQVRPALIPGATTRWLVEKRKVPELAAQFIESTPWNQSLVYLSVLTAAAGAMEELQRIENTRDYQETIAGYRRTIAAGLELLQRENDCLVKDGLPYFFHAHEPRRDQEIETRIDHPMYRGEDTATAGSIVRQLVYIWESGESFRCPTALVAGYTNAMVDLLDHPTGNHNGRPYPRETLDSPWYLAATGQRGTVAKRLAEEFIATAPFAAGIFQAQRRWNSRKDKNEDLQLLRAATLYKEWQRRQQRSGN